MKRPAFQFYTADWRNNAKLRRCSAAARGVWMDVLCVLHDSDEYGVCRWPLADLANSANAPIKLVRELVDKDVLKGADRGAQPYVYTPRHAGKDGDSVTLVEAGAGPCWYSSRFVRDEWVRQRRGSATQFSEENQPPKKQPKAPPKHTIGDRQGDGPTSSSTYLSKPSASHPPSGRADEFWQAWPKSERKQDRAKVFEHWRAKGLDALADVILADVRIKRGSQKWAEGFVEAPLVYLRGKRWEDGVMPDEAPPKVRAMTFRERDAEVSRATAAKWMGSVAPLAAQPDFIDMESTNGTRLSLG
jgi:hypothetical protein